MSASDAAAFVLFSGVFVFVGVVLYLASEWSVRHRRAKAQNEMRNRLLDKFATASELIAFLQSPGSMELMNAMVADGYTPERDILRAIQRGIILLLLGIGCLSLHLHYRSEDNPLLVFAVLLSCLGIGFLISAAVSRRLSRNVGLIKASGNPQP